MADEQAGFRRDRSTIQQILLLRLIAEKASRNNKIVYNCFVDFQKAFVSIKLDIIWATLRSYGVGKRLVQILRDMGERSKMAVKFGQEVGEWFTTTIGTRPYLAKYLYNIFGKSHGCDSRKWHRNISAR